MAEFALANPGRGFEPGVAHDDEILGDGTELFAVEFGGVEVIHMKTKELIWPD